MAEWELWECRVVGLRFSSGTGKQDILKTRVATAVLRLSQLFNLHQNASARCYFVTLLQALFLYRYVFPLPCIATYDDTNTGRSLAYIFSKTRSNDARCAHLLTSFFFFFRWHVSLFIFYISCRKKKEKKKVITRLPVTWLFGVT